MPIIWKNSFTIQFIIACLMGRVKSPQTFARVMAEKYDLSIKSGFGMVGLPPVPFPTGKKPLLEIAILIGMLELLLILIKIFKKIKGSSNKEAISVKNNLAKKVEEFNKELSKLKGAYADNIKDLVETLSPAGDAAGVLSVDLLGDENAGYFASVKRDKNNKCEKSFLVPLPYLSTNDFDEIKTELANDNITKKLKDKIKSSAEKVFDLNSNLIDDFNNNAKDSIGAAIDNAMDSSQNLDLKPIIKRLILNWLKGLSIFAVILMIPKIIKTMVTALTVPITKALKFIAKLQKAIASLSTLGEEERRIMMQSLKAVLTLTIASLAIFKQKLIAIPKKALAIFKINPIKFLAFPKPDLKLNLKLALIWLKKKEINLATNETAILQKKSKLKSDNKKLNDIKAAVDTAIEEAVQNPQSGNQSPGQQPLLSDVQYALAEILKCKQISDGDKQEILNSPTNLAALSAVKDQSTDTKNTIDALDKKLEAIKKDKNHFAGLARKYSHDLSGKGSDLNVKLFNTALNVGLLAYWIGGVWPAAPGIATVIFPGVPPLSLGMNVSFQGPKAFFGSLEKIFMAHAATVGGIFTVPGTPPIITPWVGYY